MKNRRWLELTCICTLLAATLTGCWKPRMPALLPLSPCHKERATPPAPLCQPPPYIYDGQRIALAQLVDIGLCNQPTSKEIWAQAKQAVAALGIAESSLYPTVDGTLTVTRAHPAQLTLLGSIYGYTTYAASLYVNYLLLDFGGRDAGIESAKAALVAANWNYSWQIQTVMINVIQAYYQLIAAEELLVARQADLENAEMTLAASEAQFSAGIDTIVDVLQAKAQYYNAKLNLVNQEVSLETAQATLASAVGVRPDTQFDVVYPDLSNIHEVQADTCRLVQEAKYCRADLQALRARIQSQAALIAQANSAFYPTLNFNGQYGTTYFKHLGSDGADFNFELVMNLPIFNGFNDLNSYLQAIADWEEAVAALQVQENAVFLTLLTNYYTVRGSVASVEYSREYLEYAEEAYDAILVGYRSGINDIVDLLQAQATLSDARSALIQAETTYFISLANLAYARGGLVDA